MTVTGADRRLRIEASEVFRGANIYLDRPAVKLSMNYGRIKHLNNASEKLLLDCLPEITQIGDAPTSLLAEDRKQLAQKHISEITAHAIVALMRRTGEYTSRFLVRNADKGETGIIVCEYERSARNVLDAAELALQLITAAVTQNTQFVHTF